MSSGTWLLRRVNWDGTLSFWVEFLWLVGEFRSGVLVFWGGQEFELFRGSDIQPRYCSNVEFSILLGRIRNFRMDQEF